MQYVERRPFRLTLLAVGIWAAYVVSILVTEGPTVDVLVVSAVLLLLVLPFAAVQYGNHRYTAIELSDAALRVGRESVPLVSVDRERLAAGEVEVDGRERLVGGAWAVPMMLRQLAVPLRSGEVVLVPAKRPDALREALLRTLAQA